MKHKIWTRLLLIHVGIAILVLSPFLPGPPNGLVNSLFNVGQLLAVIGLFAIPVGLIWSIKEMTRRAKNKEHQLEVKAILVLTLPLTLFTTSVYLSEAFREFSRNFAINRTEELIKSIETFKYHNGSYPDSLADLTPEFIEEIPSPFIMGIDDYHYERHGNSYHIVFQQNVVLGFNYEVVIFDPTDKHEAAGELDRLYGAGKSHWKYYVYD